MRFINLKDDPLQREKKTIEWKSRVGLYWPVTSRQCPLLNPLINFAFLRSEICSRSSHEVARRGRRWNIFREALAFFFFISLLIPSGVVVSRKRPKSITRFIISQSITFFGEKKLISWKALNNEVRRNFNNLFQIFFLFQSFCILEKENYPEEDKFHT